MLFSDWLRYACWQIMSEYNNIYLEQPRQQQGLFELQNY